MWYPGSIKGQKAIAGYNAHLHEEPGKVQHSVISTTQHQAAEHKARLKIKHHLSLSSKRKASKSLTGLVDKWSLSVSNLYSRNLAFS